MCGYSRRFLGDESVVVETAILTDFGRHVFGTFRDNANIIIRVDATSNMECFVGLSLTLKYVTIRYLSLNDTDRSYFVKICFLRRFDNVLPDFLLTSM